MSAAVAALVAAGAGAVAVLLTLRRPALLRAALPRAGPDACEGSGGYDERRRAEGGVVGDDGRAPTRLRLAAAGGAAVGAAVLLPGWYAVAGAVLAGGLVWHRSAGWEDRGVRRRREELEAEVVHIVDLLSAAVSAGAAPAHALHEVTALLDGAGAEALRRWSRRLRWGSEPTDVWADMATHEQLGRLGQVLLRSAVSGAPVAESLARLAEDERDRQRGQVEARVRQIEVKAAAPLGLCLLPAFVLLGIVPLVAGSVTGLVLG
ncbi:type II secretion system F family protein [Nocardioides sp. HDW12B]|uniref:type II secretion system F family protein n=1 Tax=Nocardioides sp. HDW12B TaxID=2714939 RepID=UPI00140D7729|nr:type II secretion system F family protein [Nocardioides sp. HDW12B]QIK67633.1 type II secretion system F family protein [Nocardioides sp. HDW12B]